MLREISGEGDKTKNNKNHSCQCTLYSVRYTLCLGLVLWAYGVRSTLGLIHRVPTTSLVEFVLTTYVYVAALAAYHPCPLEPHHISSRFSYPVNLYHGAG